MLRIFATLSFGAAFFTSGFFPAAAQSMMSGSTTMPHCSSGDPAVMVNSKDKTYSMVDKSHMMMHSSAADKSMMMKNHMSMMCKSKADAMGAHMMKSSMSGSMQH